MNNKNKNEIETKSHLLWGQDLHKNNFVAPHSPQLESVFKEKWRDALKGDLLEIGCGSGSDIEIFSKIKEIKKITAIDLGENIEKLIKKYEEEQDIDISRGNALSLDFDDEKFDVIYSFGVFHHTSDPIKCISEAYRVLKTNGTIFLYLYSSHEDLLFKRIGIFLETIVMKFFGYIPYSFQNLICILLSPLCWVVFSIPSNMLKFFGFKNFSKKLPFYFGTHPFSLIGDLKDRLMSPINHRFSKSQIKKILESINFSLIEVVKTSSGLYLYAKK
ncbi:class I SAM-dependent methyltransferase [Gammaproteobacteria bacterium]|nr:class I SAM-dependent methyltransferase [Gammaproteobacteria bacterium]